MQRGPQGRQDGGEQPRRIEDPARGAGSHPQPALATDQRVGELEGGARIGQHLVAAALGLVERRHHLPIPRLGERVVEHLDGVPPRCCGLGAQVLRDDVEPDVGQQDLEEHQRLEHAGIPLLQQRHRQQLSRAARRVCGRAQG